MTKFVLVALPTLLLYSLTSPFGFIADHRINIDSGKIQHRLDGSSAEWPADLFHKDEETGISYAFDNDQTDLFVVLRVKDFPEQMKMIRMGMRMFIDLKAKKKENMGIEFPVKKEMTQTGSGRTGSDDGGSGEGVGERKRFDPKAMRERLILNLISMKIFGFEGMDETREIGLTMLNTANLACNWDSLDVMNIEYKIPLVMIADPHSLENKNITIGWKIFGVETPVGSGGGGIPSGGSSRFGGSGSGRNGGGRTPAGTGSTADNRQQNFEKMREEQTLWGKYTFVFPTAVKGF